MTRIRLHLILEVVDIGNPPSKSPFPTVRKVVETSGEALSESVLRAAPRPVTRATRSNVLPLFRKVG